MSPTQVLRTWVLWVWGPRLLRPSPQGTPEQQPSKALGLRKAEGRDGWGPSKPLSALAPGKARLHRVPGRGVGHMAAQPLCPALLPGGCQCVWHCCLSLGQAWLVPWLAPATLDPALEAGHTSPFKAKIGCETQKGEHSPGTQGAFFLPLLLK